MAEDRPGASRSKKQAERAIKEDLAAMLPRGPGRPKKARGPHVDRPVDITTPDRVAFWAQELEIRRRACDEALEAGHFNALALLIPKFDAARIQWETAVAEEGNTDRKTDAEILAWMIADILPNITRADRDTLRTALAALDR